ncbi:hypothetical protein DM02DRAFT_388652 [Periconia macrospinosa]|uniref:Uncharacterized protein n=1 Tax=Periconia macrospinosa TaxID=97972 RepID=A0A2V1DRB5_9PLEO|nr:hypothetical protein DM02DRAFT_388652 [Periconia macrospinosa]
MFAEWWARRRRAGGGMLLRVWRGARTDTSWRRWEKSRALVVVGGRAFAGRPKASRDGVGQLDGTLGVEMVVWVVKKRRSVGEKKEEREREEKRKKKGVRFGYGWRG